MAHRADVRVARRWTTLALAAAVLLAPLPVAGGEATPARCVSRRGADGPVGEVSLAGRVVVRLRGAAGDLDVPTRCRIVARRLNRALAAGPAPRPYPRVHAGRPVVVSGDRPLVMPTRAAASANGTSPAVLAWVWSNNLRRGLDLDPLPRHRIPFRGLPGLQRLHASWYGHRFAGRLTASGEPFDPGALTAAHRALPFGTRLRVIAPWSGAQVIVRVNDRGPWVGGRELDLSLAAARAIGLAARGVGTVLVEVVGGGAR